MNCSNHNDVNAIAVCTVCGRGICKECTTFARDSAACLGRCEEMADIERDSRNRQAEVNKAYLDAAYPDEHLLRFQANAVNAKFWLFLVSVAGVFLIYNLYQTATGQGLLFIWLLAIWSMFLLGAISSLRKWLKLLRHRQEVIDKWRTR